MSRRAVSLLSGGLDSTTLLYHLRSENTEPTALIVNYGQRHAVELLAAMSIVEELGIDYRSIDFSATAAKLFKGAKSSQVGDLVDVPHGHYAAENMKTTIVPNRNMMLIAMAGALAESIGAELVCFAAHAGDHAIYPDCRPDFYASATTTLHLATGGKVQLYNPFIYRTKTEIAAIAHELKVPVGLTWSCYDPQDPQEVNAGGVGHLIHCGQCGTCVERKEAFRDAGVPDPTEYAA